MNINEPVKTENYKNISTEFPSGYPDITQEIMDNLEESPAYDPRSPTDRDIPLEEYYKQIEEEYEKQEKEKQEKEKQEKKKKYTSSKIYTKNIINNRVHLNISEIGNNVQQIILEKIKNKYEGKCSKEGFIKPNSIKLVTYSSGLLKNGKIEFDVVYECFICKPVEGMIIQNCIVKNVTKAGIRAETKEEVSPVVIFISRDHHYQNSDFGSINENDSIIIRVIGIRYELNDKYISIIAEYVDKFVPQKRKLRIKKK